ncbi:MRP-L47-domain-containing protein [Xylariaceae sp. FL0662B]|nr:MRP-L47-domain-containing protein [Xylariaceae sp. FL0662B]
MATTTFIRPSIGRILTPTKNCRATNSSFLAVLTTNPTQSCPFSSTPERNMRKPRRDNNRLRGLSAIHRSGPRFRMNIGKEQIPQPTDYVPTTKVNPNHGLWDFFYSKEALLPTPEEGAEHGRAWTVEELRHKSWNDLHKLWWVCVKEQNRIATAQKEMSRLKLRSGDEEVEDRLYEVRKTMRAIKHVLTERYYLWEDARKLAEEDPEIDLNNTSSPYTPKDYLEEDAVAGDTEGTEAEAEAEAVAPEEGEQGSHTEPEKVDPSTLPKDPEPQQPPART